MKLLKQAKKDELLKSKSSAGNTADMEFIRDSMKMKNWTFFGTVSSYTNSNSHMET